MQTKTGGLVLGLIRLGELYEVLIEDVLVSVLGVMIIREVVFHVGWIEVYRGYMLL